MRPSLIHLASADYWPLYHGSPAALAPEGAPVLPAQGNALGSGEQL
jgi:hypothetical protein